MTISANGGGESTQYHHPDRLGTRLVTNAQDTTFFEQQTLPFGTGLNESTAGSPAGVTTGVTSRRFTTYERSFTTGLDYALNRHYDPQQGRFTQVDPIGMRSVSLASPQTLNLYAYCTNDPVNHTDPSGLGFFSFIGKIFKSIGKVFVAAARVAVKVLASKWGQLLIALAIFAFLGPAAPIGFALLGAEGSATFGMLTTGFLIQGVIAAGTLANHFQQIEKPKKIVGATAEQVAIIEAAIADLINRIKTRKECARLLGGQQKALKALRESTISVEPLTAQVVIPESGPFAGKVLYEKILAGETSGKTIKLGSNTTMAPGGKISAINVATGKIVELQGVPADINEISETLGHELSHRTKSKKIIQDDNDPAQSAENDARVRKACGYH